MEWFEIAKGFIASNVIAIFGSVGIAFGLGYLLKKVDLVGKLLDRGLDRIELDLDKPEDRELMRAFIKWAEIKVPDHGMGAAKSKLVIDRIVKLYPRMDKHRDKMQRVIDAIVVEINDTLKARAKK